MLHASFPSASCGRLGNSPSHKDASGAKAPPNRSVMRLVITSEASWQTACDEDPVSSFSTGRKLAAEEGWEPELTTEAEEMFKEDLASLDEDSGQWTVGRAVSCSSSKACCCNGGSSKTSCTDTLTIPHSSAAQWQCSSSENRSRLLLQSGTACELL